VPAIEVNPSLLGVGYIIGTRISCVMFGGGVLASFVLIPAIRLFGDGLEKSLYPSTHLIREMDEDDIWHEYILYIGAGAVAAGGIISLCQALPLILASLKAGLSEIGAFNKTGSGGRSAHTPRTDRDLPLWIVGAGAVALVVAIWATQPLHEVLPLVPDLQMNPLGALLIVLFGFLFVTVSSRITGEIGSSSNPISGMTVATLLLTCFIFLVLGWTDPGDRLTALSVAAVVCIAASNAGTTSQDLKTGYLVGSTPMYQQVAILIGALSSALVIGWILIMLNDAATVYSRKDLPVLNAPLDVKGLAKGHAPDDDGAYYVWHAPQGNKHDVPQGKYLVSEDGKEIKYLVDPGINGKRNRDDNGNEVRRYKAPKAQLMALITDGILEQKLPWSLVLLGVAIAVVLELCSVPSLAFAVGVYLPLSTSTPIFAGGLVRYVAEKLGRRPIGASETESDSSPGVLMATGYIAGGAIAGVLVGFLSFSDTIPSLLGTWQYRVYTTSASDKSFESLCEEAARSELELTGKKDLNAEEKVEVDKLAAQIKELNEGKLPKFVPVPAGTILKLPGNKTFKVEQAAQLGTVAEQALGSADKAGLLLDDNKEKLKLPQTLPTGTQLRLPQWTTPALMAFGVLVLLLLFVGLGWILRSPPLLAQPETGNHHENVTG